MPPAPAPVAPIIVTVPLNPSADKPVSFPANHPLAGGPTLFLGPRPALHSSLHFLDETTSGLSLGDLEVAGGSPWAGICYLVGGLGAFTF